MRLSSLLNGAQEVKNFDAVSDLVRIISKRKEYQNSGTLHTILKIKLNGFKDVLRNSWSKSLTGYLFI